MQCGHFYALEVENTETKASTVEKRNIRITRTMDKDFQVGDLVVFKDLAFESRYGLYDDDDSLGVVIYDQSASSSIVVVFWFSDNVSSWCWKKNLEKVSK